MTSDNGPGAKLERDAGWQIHSAHQAARLQRALKRRLRAEFLKLGWLTLTSYAARWVESMNHAH